MNEKSIDPVFHPHHKVNNLYRLLMRKKTGSKHLNVFYGILRSQLIRDVFQIIN